MMDEFASLPEIARSISPTLQVPVVRRANRTVDTRTVSGLHWGTSAPEVVFLHGNGQNAHTWDATILALGSPALAVDLPGHGHSDWHDDPDYTPSSHAAAVAGYLRHGAPNPCVLVGMSLGGLTAICLAVAQSTWVRHLVVVDVTPQSGLRVAARHAHDTGRVGPPAGSDHFVTFEDMVDAAAAVQPTRSRDGLRRGVRHNAIQGTDGLWRWRADHRRRVNADSRPVDYSEQWSRVSELTVPVTLVRAARSGVVPLEDATEFVRRARTIEVVTIDTELHSVQSARPEELAELVRSRLG